MPGLELLRESLRAIFYQLKKMRKDILMILKASRLGSSTVYRQTGAGSDGYLKGAEIAP